MGAESKVFTYSDVSAHKTSDDCWVIINGKVYNVTSYLDEHPGGDEVILGQAGNDASQEFEDVGHGSAARLMLDEFYVGEVDPTTKVDAVDLPPTKVQDSDDKEKSKESTKFLHFLLSLGIVGLALAFLLFNFSR
ncbi:cytochrome b5-like [Salvia miltiorrhiza]|uniref:cytochrome b5-like n=1 Tax=Salvia miltiorrhiza TaxID=226208 RepID=UPI0025AD4759|nr:cytochrome b5-like [Salvia miltiorrhiza]